MSSAWWQGLVDDAAIFPPGNLPLDRAVAEHREHRASEYADLVGGFVISDVKVADLIDVLDDAPELVEPVETPLGVNLVVTGGAGAIEPAARWLNRAPTVSLRAVEFALRDEEDLAHNAQRAITAWDLLEDDNPDAQVYIEMPRLNGAPTHGWLAAMDEVAARGLRVKFRTGGVEQQMFPTCGELGDAISAALDRELEFKCTAGLHHALRHHDSATDLTHHGFLNVLRATRAALDGDDPSEVLAEESAAVLLEDFDPDEALRTRRWFTGFGSCSVLDPHEDLVDLGLL
ncbi:hypothetical protein [Nocardioides marmorisolisilvae]|uniref:Uncharacterized protein n=1 Tax=Nocardioides marmorisolisilvae TaxID=1542737 RepID=A0A3N0DT77_9ACTN|nr:hypothetical protein [Nocardioides marmorisolisilvae]RNL78711.1 hypothetical protein EFL95_06405 [Nocardioides marmorisolisilvae]